MNTLVLKLYLLTYFLTVTATDLLASDASVYLCVCPVRVLTFESLDLDSSLLERSIRL